MKKNNLSIIQFARHLTQLIFFILLPGLYISAFNGIKVLYLASIEQGTNISQISPQLVEVIAIIPITIILGRYFCGWVCAFGSFGDLIYGISRRLFKRKPVLKGADSCDGAESGVSNGAESRAGNGTLANFRIDEETDSLLKYLKYIVLVAIIAFLWTFSIGDFASFNPWDVFGMIASFTSTPDFSYISANLAGGLVLLLIITVGSAFVERFFCRYLCPLGAVFSLISRFTLFKIKKPRKKCGSCSACTSGCAMGIPLYKTNKVNSGECIQCMKCSTLCPKKNASPAVFRKKLKPITAAMIALILFTGLYFGGGAGIKGISGSSSSVSMNNTTTTTPTENNSTDSNSGSNADSQSINDSNIADSSSGSSAASSVGSSNSSNSSTNSLYEDGTYEGSGIGFKRRTTTVSVVVQDGKISNISTESTGDDKPFYERAFSSVVEDIIDSQSTDVDTVSGATYSSRGIMDAVADALSGAAK